LPVLIVISFFIFTFAVKAGFSNIAITPLLDVARFAPYKITADISGSPTSVQVEVEGINGQNPSPNCRNYTVDGVCLPETTTKNMSYNSTSSKWESQNIFPNDIYPQIVFAESNVTWYNQPLDASMWRRNYQLLKFANPFAMADGASFFIELNIAPSSLTNSNDLFVYLISKNANLATYFNSDWRNKADTELVATFNKTNTVHHQHTANSGHFLVSLSANSDGTIGAKNLDVSNQFWVVLYQDSPNIGRGWKLRYQPSSLCTNSANWYSADRSGGNTWNAPVLQAGCPDAHVHVVRRLTDLNTTIQDSVKATLTANFSGSGSETTTQNFYFNSLPNLAPNSTSFISPSSGGVYNSNISISWNSASDANNDPLLYSIYLLDSGGTVIDTLLSASTSTNFTWDISSVPNGDYSLKGVITEDNDNPLSTDFYLGGNFTINKTSPIYSLSALSINSDNANGSLAKAGDTISLSLTSTGSIAPNISFYSGGVAVNNSISITPASGTSFLATYVVSSLDTNGAVSFVVSADNLDQAYSNTMDDSYVEVDVSSPSDVSSSVATGIYDTAQSVALTSDGSDFIKYTSNGSSPTCVSGTTYTGVISVDAPITIKAIACDLSGNYSAVSTFVYDFQYTVTFVGNGGTGHSPSTALVNYNATTTLPTDPSRVGYTFTSWNMAANGSGDVFDETTVVTGNLTVYAIWTINNYSLTYNGNGQTSGDPYTAESHDYDTNVTVKDQNTLLKTDYAFSGWNTAADGSGVNYAAGSLLTMTENLVLYAQWLDDSKCTVIFDGNGGAGHVPGSRAVTCGQTLSSSALTLPSDPTQAGYTFNSWNTNSGGTGSAFDVNTVIGSNFMVYAQWDGNSYLLNFDAQGGTVSSSSQSVVYGAAIGTLPTPSKTNYTFVSWNTAADGSGTDYNSSTVYSVSGDTTLYATWSADSYIINFDAQGGTVSSSSQFVVYGAAVGTLPTPSKTNYTFVSWNTAADGSGTDYNSSTVYSVSGNLDLYAEWVGNTYSLAFSAQGGANSDNQSVVYNSAVGALPTPTRSNYTFSGWYTEPNGDGIQYTAATVYGNSSNIVLYAKWTANSYVLSFDAQGGEVSPSTKSVYYNSAVGTLPTPSKTNYTFVSWNTAADGSGTDYNSSTVYTVSGNATVYAQYNINQYTLNYSAGSNGSISGITSQVVNYGASGSSVTANPNANYRFRRWSDGSTSNPRTDINVLTDINVSAEFLFSGTKGSIIYSTEKSVPEESVSEKSTSSIDIVPVVDNICADDYLKIVTEREISLLGKIDDVLANYLLGRILLQVETNGQAWYLEPVSEKKYFMGRPCHAFNLMRRFGLGINNVNLDKFLKTGAPRSFSGRIFLAVERHGEAYYVNPSDLKLYYLGRPADAFSVMRRLSLGISNNDIRKIEVGKLNFLNLK